MLLKIYGGFKSITLRQLQKADLQLKWNWYCLEKNIILKSKINDYYIFSSTIQTIFSMIFYIPLWHSSYQYTMWVFPSPSPFHLFLLVSFGTLHHYKIHLPNPIPSPFFHGTTSKSPPSTPLHMLPISPCV